MNLLTVIPEEVIEGCVLPYLKWNDLLRFRRVCKTSKDITTGFLRTHAELAPWIEINEKEKNFRAFLEMGIPTTKISLDNLFSGNEFYESDEDAISQFLEKYGPLLKRLAVRQVTVLMYGKEWDFLEALVNLEDFTAGFYGYGRIAYSPEKGNQISEMNIQRAKLDPRCQAQLLFPSSFKQLRSLKIGQNEHLRIPDHVIEYTREFLQFSKELERVSMPFRTTSSPLCFGPEQFRDPQYILYCVFVMLSCYIKLRAMDAPEKENLKIFDFLNYHGLTDSEMRALVTVGSQGFLELCETCLKHGVKLWNVDPLWFIMRDQYPNLGIADQPELTSPDLGIPVVSLVELSPQVFPLNMPNLERIVIRATSATNVGEDWRQVRPVWPALKYLEITVDSKKVSYTGTLDGVLPFSVKTSSLFQFFFQDVQRGALAELHLMFMDKTGGVAVPKTEEIVTSCPNLKKLSLVNWPGTNKALVKLWNGLLDLEEISLESCTALGNVAFVGENEKDPVFLKLTKLRKLSLKDLYKMPKITDTLFSLVLRHMKLSHFIITSMFPVTSVTQAGILSLLQGEFAESIEKFPFQDWDLPRVSQTEFKKLGEKFRSYNML